MEVSKFPGAGSYKAHAYVSSHLVQPSHPPSPAAPPEPPHPPVGPPANELQLPVAVDVKRCNRADAVLAFNTPQPHACLIYADCAVAQRIAEARAAKVCKACDLVGLRHLQHQVLVLEYLNFKVVAAHLADVRRSWGYVAISAPAAAVVRCRWLIADTRRNCAVAQKAGASSESSAYEQGSAHRPHLGTHQQLVAAVAVNVSQRQRRHHVASHGPEHVAAVGIKALPAVQEGRARGRAAAAWWCLPNHAQPRLVVSATAPLPAREQGRPCLTQAPACLTRCLAPLTCTEQLPPAMAIGRV